ncbi:F-box protein At2g17690-like [Ananas comosus]|nr:F-box protein At2g17690-like [Ananas comosus]
MRCSVPPVGSAEEPSAEVIAFGFPYDDLIWGDSTYLVEHQGSLLQVLRKRRASKKTRPDKPLPQHLTFGFHVFRLDPSSSAWEMIESLGDGALFLGMNTSVSVSAADLRWCKGDCIYFTDGDELSRWYAISLGGRLLGGRGAGRDTGYCTLKDWEVHYLDQVASYSPSSPPIWVLPSAGEG